MTNYSYFKCRFVRCELGFGGTPSLQGKGALVDIFDADSREKRNFLFAHTKMQKVYYHEYVMPPQNNLFVVRAANDRVREYVGDHFEVITEADSPYVYVVIDAASDEPLVAIENCDYCKWAPKEVHEVLEYSLCRELGAMGWHVKLEPYCPNQREKSRISEAMSEINDPPCTDRTLQKMYGYEKTDFMIRHYLSQKVRQKMPRKSDDLEDYVLHHDVNLVLKLLDDVLRKLRGSQAVSRPFRFLQDKEILARPTFKAVIKYYPYLKNKVSETRFNEYTNPEITQFVNDKLYEKYHETFSTILKDITK